MRARQLITCPNANDTSKLRRRDESDYTGRAADDTFSHLLEHPADQEGDRFQTRRRFPAGRTRRFSDSHRAGPADRDGLDRKHRFEETARCKLSYSRAFIESVTRLVRLRKEHTPLLRTGDVKRRDEGGAGAVGASGGQIPNRAQDPKRNGATQVDEAGTQEDPVGGQDERSRCKISDFLLFVFVDNDINSPPFSFRLPFPITG